MDDSDEVLDLVDENDKVIGTILRSRTHDLHSQGFLRAAEIFIQNSHGKLWIPRRQMHKRIVPGGLDYSSSGHIGTGETYLKGCLREVQEELNLKLTKKDLQFVHKFKPIDNLDYFRALYIYKSDKVPRYNTDDFSEYYWLTPAELLIRLKAGEPAKRSLMETAAYLIDHKL